MPSETKPKAKPAIDMRKSKLKASEAAMLAGELNKPSWESRNEGIHERVSFEDAIWGFDLAGGSFYKTPLRVTAVKKDSRAEKAGIRPGDNLLRINDIDTSTLTIQEAHEIIIESGVHLRLAVTAPDDEEDSYHCWVDPLEQSGYDSDEERRKEAERAKKREVHAKVSSYWSLQWPWVSKRRIIYRESNCFMVPSKFEDRHRDKFPLETNFGPKKLDDIVLNSANAEKGQRLQEEMKNGEAFNNAVKVEEIESKSEVNASTGEKQMERDNITNTVSSDVKSEPSLLTDNSEKRENMEQSMDVQNAKQDVGITMDAESITESDKVLKLPTENETDLSAETEIDELQETSEECLLENSRDTNAENVTNDDLSSQDDEIFDEMLGQSTENGKEEDETVFNDILNDSDAQNSENIDENQR